MSNDSQKFTDFQRLTGMLQDSLLRKRLEAIKEIDSILEKKGDLQKKELLFKLALNNSEYLVQRDALRLLIKYFDKFKESFTNLIPIVLNLLKNGHQEVYPVAGKLLLKLSNNEILSIDDIFTFLYYSLKLNLNESIDFALEILKKIQPFMFNEKSEKKFLKILKKNLAGKDDNLIIKNMRLLISLKIIDFSVKKFFTKILSKPNKYLPNLQSTLRKKLLLICATHFWNLKKQGYIEFKNLNKKFPVNKEIAQKFLRILSLISQIAKSNEATLKKIQQILNNLSQEQLNLFFTPLFAIKSEINDTELNVNENNNIKNKTLNNESIHLQWYLKPVFKNELHFKVVRILEIPDFFENLENITNEKNEIIKSSAIIKIKEDIPLYVRLLYEIKVFNKNIIILLPLVLKNFIKEKLKMQNGKEISSTTKMNVGKTEKAGLIENIKIKKIEIPDLNFKTPDFHLPEIKIININETEKAAMADESIDTLLEQQNKDKRFCPFCYHEIKKGEKICPFCGVNLD
ncbi:MAG: hypothetical protein ACP6IY_12595 [Promethearchaeia archaeon]